MGVRSPRSQNHLPRSRSGLGHRARTGTGDDLPPRQGDPPGGDSETCEKGGRTPLRNPLRRNDLPVDGGRKDAPPRPLLRRRAGQPRDDAFYPFRHRPDFRKITGMFDSQGVRHHRWEILVLSVGNYEMAILDGSLLTENTTYSLIFACFERTRSAANGQ